MYLLKFGEREREREFFAKLPKFNFTRTFGKLFLK